MEKSISLQQIGTPRLTIRPLTEEDIPNVYGLMSDFETASRAGFRPVASSSEAEGYLRESIRSGHACGITLKEKPWDVFGIMTILPEDDESGDGANTRTVEIGYFMRIDMRGNGYMPEAVHAMTTYLFTVQSSDKIIIRVIKGNDASRKVAEKCGFRYEGLEKEAGPNGATGEMESLEWYSMTRPDFFEGKGMKGNMTVDIVTPGRVLSEGCPGVPRLHTFFEGDRAGLKDEDGQVVFKPEWDTIQQWEDADVVYARRGDEYHYFNTRGESILTEVAPLEGVDDGVMPYYVSEEQGRPEMMSFTLANGPDDAACCYMKGRWVRLGRLLRKDIGAFLGNGDLVRFRNGAFDEFFSPFTYIYSAFEAVCQRDDDVAGCIDRLRLMGCYDKSWSYLTSVWVSPSADHVIRYPSSVFAPFELLLSNEDLHRISVGVDPQLPDGAVRIRQVRYFKDRWPLPEELAFQDAIVEGTRDEMIRQRALALSRIRELSRPELRSAAVKDFLQNHRFPGRIYRSKGWDETVRKIRQLLSFGYKLGDAVWRLAETLCRDIAAADGPFDFGCAGALVPWLVSEGADVNHVRGLSTPLDVLARTREALEEKGGAPQETLSGLDEIITAVKESGGKTVEILCAEQGDDPGRLLGIFYPWVK